MINIYSEADKKLQNSFRGLKKTWGNLGKKNIKITVNNRTIYSCRKCFKCGGRILSNFIYFEKYKTPCLFGIPYLSLFCQVLSQIYVKNYFL